MNSAPTSSVTDSNETGQDGNNKKNPRILMELSPMKQDSDSRDSGCAVEETSFR